MFAQKKKKGRATKIHSFFTGGLKEKKQTPDRRTKPRALPAPDASGNLFVHLAKAAEVEQTLYADLELEDEACDGAAIKQQYRELIKKWHPDRMKRHEQDAAARAECQARARTINEAYRVLSDAVRRGAYDAQLGEARRAKAGAMAAQATAAAPRRLQ